ncbi:MAG: prepilin-type N-terminal cleavage/methylation domain-containing protein [Candidatus Omnitrophica bacterium]|nr:prepilin-type N-terminal cleavage/methylation domain-containing protein [Candidatus Omnitrophota bacterium]
MKKHFTLIELIVVIAIIAILAAIIAPNAFKAIEKAKISRAIAELKNIKTASLSYYADNGRFPCNKVGGWGKDPGFVNPVTPANCWPDELHPGENCTAAGVCVDGTTWDGPYLEKWPYSSPWLGTIPGGVDPEKKSGMYSWNNWVTITSPDGSICNNVKMISLQTRSSIPYAALEKIDSASDDGNLSTGNVFKRYPYSGDPDNPDYLVYMVGCDK